MRPPARKGKVEEGESGEGAGGGALGQGAAAASSAHDTSTAPREKMGEEGESGLGPAICAPGGAGALVQGAAAAFFAPGASTTLPPAIPRPSMGPRLARAAQEPLRDASVKPAGVMQQACARDSRSTRSNRPKDRGSRGRCARGSRCWQELGSTGVGSASRGWHAPLCSARLSKIDSVLVSCFRASTTAPNALISLFALAPTGGMSYVRGASERVSWGLADQHRDNQIQRLLKYV